MDARRDRTSAWRPARRSRSRRKVEDIATGARLLVDDEGGATTLVTVTGVATTSQSLGGLTDSVTVLTVTPSIPAIADRRRVTVYELAGPAIPFWGAAFPERLTGGTVFLPGRLVDAETIEVGRTIAAGEFEPGVRLRLEDVSPGRTVLVGDAATEPAAGTVESAALVGSTVSFEPTPADKTSVRELGLDALSATPVTCLVSGPVPSSFALSSAQPTLVVRIGDVGPRTLTLGAVTTRSRRRGRPPDSAARRGHRARAGGGARVRPLGPPRSSSRARRAARSSSRAPTRTTRRSTSSPSAPSTR